MRLAAYRTGRIFERGSGLVSAVRNARELAGLRVNCDRRDRFSDSKQCEWKGAQGREGRRERRTHGATRSASPVSTTCRLLATGSDPEAAEVEPTVGAEVVYAFPRRRTATVLLLSIVVEV